MRKRRLTEGALARPFEFSDSREVIEVGTLCEALLYLFDGYLSGVMELNLSPYTSGCISVNAERLAFILRSVAKCAKDKTLPRLSVYERESRLVFEISNLPNDSLELRSVISEQACAAGLTLYAEGDSVFLGAELQSGARIRFYARSREDTINAFLRVFST